MPSSASASTVRTPDGAHDAHDAAARAPASVDGLPLVGVDWGSRGTALMCAEPVLGAPGAQDRRGLELASAVAYPPEGRPVIGDRALGAREMRRLRPLKHGRPADPRAAADFAAGLRRLVGRDGDVAAVVSTSASTPSERETGREDPRRSELRDALRGAFDRSLLVPSPFLAALGARERLRAAGAPDPVTGCLVVDLGAGTTDIGAFWGAYPEPAQTLSLEVGGDDVDAEILALVRRAAPRARFHLGAARALKEGAGYVGDAPGRIRARVRVDGAKSRTETLDLTDVVGQACDLWVRDLPGILLELITGAEDAAQPLLAGTILLTGGGAALRGLAPWLEEQVSEWGFGPCRAWVVDDHRRAAALGALRCAHMARRDQWQVT